MAQIVFFSILLGFHHSWASENSLSGFNSAESIDEVLDILGISVDTTDEMDQADGFSESSTQKYGAEESDIYNVNDYEMNYSREPAGSSRKSNSYKVKNSSSSRSKSPSKSRSSSKSSSRSGCSSSVTLSQSQQRIMKCLDEASVKSERFINNLLRVERNPGQQGFCARYVAEASRDSGWTQGKPQGCIGREKTTWMLNKDRAFIDLVKYSTQAGSFSRVGALTPAGLAISRIAPIGSVFSYYGNNRGSCGGKGGLGHMMAKVNNSKFCHFKCDRCPALPARYVDKVVVKIQKQYLPSFRQDTNLDSICNDINVVRSSGVSRGEPASHAKGKSQKSVN